MITFVQDLSIRVITLLTAFTRSLILEQLRLTKLQLKNNGGNIIIHSCGYDAPQDYLRH